MEQRFSGDICEPHDTVCGQWSSFKRTASTDRFHPASLPATPSLSLLLALEMQNFRNSSTLPRSRVLWLGVLLFVFGTTYLFGWNFYFVLLFGTFFLLAWLDEWRDSSMTITHAGIQRWHWFCRKSYAWHEVTEVSETVDRLVIYMGSRKIILHFYYYGPVEELKCFIKQRLAVFHPHLADPKSTLLEPRKEPGRKA